MAKIRILLANEPGLTRKLMRSLIERQPDMEVVGEVVDPIEVLLSVGEMSVDVVVLSLNSAEQPGICSHLLAEYPRLRILAFTPHINSAFLYSLSFSSDPVHDLSANGVFDAIRKSVVRT